MGMLQGGVEVCGKETREKIERYWRKYADAAAHYFAKIFGFSPLREFAYSLDPKKKVQGRHLHFSDVSKLAWWLRKKAPAHFYFGPIVDGKLVVSRELVFECDVLNFQTLKEETALMLKTLKMMLPNTKVFVTHTGGRSFHVYIVRKELAYLPSLVRRELVNKLMKKKRKLVGGNIHGRRVKRVSLSTHGDPKVSTDVRRVTRFPFSIHGKYMTVCWPVTKVPTTYDEAIELVNNFKGPVRVETLVNSRR